MKNQHNRVLALLLAVSMIVAMLPTMLFTVAAEETVSTSTWTKTELKDITSDDTVAITMTKDETTYVLPTTDNGDAEKPHPLADIATVAESTLTTNGAASAYGWTIVAVEGGYNIKVGDSYLYVIADNNGVRIGETAATWTVDDNGYLRTSDGTNDREIGVYTKIPDWRSYKISASGTPGSNIAGQTLGFWTLSSSGTAVDPVEPTTEEPTEAPTEEPTEAPMPTEAPTPTEPVESDDCTLLTELTDGAKVYVYAPSASLAMTGDAGDTTMLAGIEAEVNEGVLTVTGDMLALNVKFDGDGNCTFSTDDGLYLTATDKNVLTLDAAESDASVWNVTPKYDEETGEYIYSDVKNVAASNLYLEVYNGSFTVYPKYYNNAAFRIQFFSAAQTTSGGFIDTLTAGDKILIYQPKSGMVVNTTPVDAASNKDLNGTEVVLSDDGVLSGYSEADVWTVGTIEKEEKVYYTFSTADGKFMFGTYGGLFLQDSVEEGWSLKESTDVAGCYVLYYNYPCLSWSEDGSCFSMSFQYTELNALRFYRVGGGGGSSVKTVSTPSASPRSGELFSGDTVTFSCKTEGATIVYKVNDSEEWLTYTAPITITEDVSFTVKATKEGMNDSREVTYRYTVYVPPVLGEHKAELVTDASTLCSGDLILVVATTADRAMGQMQKANNRDYGDVIKDEAAGLLSFDPETAQVIQLESGIEEGTYALYAYNGENTGYLYAPLGTSGQGSNWLRTQDTKDINGTWTIAINDDTTAVITSKADKKSNTIRYNNGIFSCYGANGQKPVAIYRLLEGNDRPGLPNEGDQVAIYNLNAKGVLSGMTGDLNDIYGCKIGKAAAVIENGKAVCSNGAVIFTVSKNGDYYRFYNASFGYLASFGTGNNTYYSAEATNETNWTLEAYNGGYTMKSTACFQDETITKPQYLQYFSDNFTTWGMHAVTDRDVFTYYFYPCANEQLTDGVVNEPKAVFGNLADAVVGQRYLLHFTVDALFGVKEIKVTLNGTELECTELNGYYTAVIPVELISGSKLTVVVSGKDNKDVAINTSVDIPVKDEPGIINVRPVANSETGDDKRPEISATLTNVGADPTIELKVNDEVVTHTYADGKVSYKPAADLADGRVTVSLSVTRADGKSITKNWNFVVGESNYQLLFGQLHSHNGEYSDGSGTLDIALDYIASIPEDDNVDFVAFTDHSNYFDNDVDGGSPKGALYDLSLATPQAQTKWTTYKTTIAEFNKTHDNVIAIAGFEMTWSGGPGHMNTFCTDGIVSRQNAELNNKTGDAGMRLYYQLLAQEEGVDSITQFNHPGTMFGNFSDFNYWSEEADSRVYLVEVGNGQGLVGASGYYPSYEQYTLALDKGWHIGPTNNQDNHGGKWGNANTARDVVLAEDFSEEAIYEAIRALRIYATEDKNLELGYTVNDLPMGTIIEEVPDTLKFDISIMDPDDTDSTAKVELIVNSGKVAYTWDDEAVLATGILTAELSPEYSYYYVRVTQADGDLAVTAPIWVGDALKLSIDDMSADTTTPVVGDKVKISTTLRNDEAADAQIKSVVYTTDGSKVLASDSTPRVLTAGSTLTLDWEYVAENAKLTTITVTVIVEMDGKDYTFSASVELDVQDVSSLAYIGFDASHDNEYVSGYNKDLMGNFTTLAAQSTVRTETLTTSEALIAACESDKYAALVLSAPSRRSGFEGKTYSEAELAAIAAYNAKGGIVILTGVGDSNDQITVDVHTAAAQNAVLNALGSSLRLSDDGLYEGTSFSFTLNAFGTSALVEGLTEGISYYGGSTIYAVDAEGNATSTLPSSVESILFANAEGTSVDKDADGLGGDSTPKYTYAEGDDRLMVMAAERIEGKGLIVVSGSTFMNDYDLAIPATNGNNALAANLIAAVNPVKITPISEVRKQTESGYSFTIEGTVTSNASGYDSNTAFFDCIYVQDATGGICCFPVATDYKIGDVVRVSARTHFFQGEAELQVVNSEKVGEAEPVKPVEITLKQLNDRSMEGKLVTLKGIVTEITVASGMPESIYVTDESGEIARIHIDGYICSDMTIEGLEVGCMVEATGLASFDDAYANKNDSDSRLRVRNRAEVVCSEAPVHTHTTELVGAKDATCTEDGYTGDLVCTVCGETVETGKAIPAAGHTTEVQGAKAATCTEDGYTGDTVCTVCGDTVKGTAIPATGHTTEVQGAKAATCTEDGYTGDTVCTVCGETVTEGTAIPATGHNYVDGKCTVCGDEEKVEKPFENPFNDVSEKQWYYSYVMKMAEAGHINGYEDGSFKPEGNLTRAEMVTMLYRVAGAPVVEGKASFTDLPYSWYQKAIAWAEKEGVVDGIGGGKFDPDGYVTREQLVTMMYRLAGKPAVKDELKGFEDVKSVSTWAEDAFKWAVANGIVNGTTFSDKEGFYLAPQDNTTRAEAAKILCVYLDME